MSSGCGAAADAASGRALHLPECFDEPGGAPLLLRTLQAARCHPAVSCANPAAVGARRASALTKQVTLPALPLAHGTDPQISALGTC